MFQNSYYQHVYIRGMKGKFDLMQSKPVSAPSHSSPDPVTVSSSELLPKCSSQALATSQQTIPSPLLFDFKPLPADSPLVSEWAPLLGARVQRHVLHPSSCRLTRLLTFSLIFILFNFFLLTFSEPRFLSTALVFLSINPLPLELPSDATSRLVMEMACKIVLQCYEHC